MSRVVGIKIEKANNATIDENVFIGCDTSIEIGEMNEGSISNNKIYNHEAKEILYQSITLINDNALEIREKISPDADLKIKSKITSSFAEGRDSVLQTIEYLTSICSNVVSFWPALYEVLKKLAESL